MTKYQLIKVRSSVLFRRLILILVLCFTGVNAKPNYELNDLLLQGAPVLSTSGNQFYWGAEVTAHCFFPMSQGYFASQITLSGGYNWMEFSPGALLAPFGVLLKKTSSNEELDIKKIMAGFLILVISMENPAVHIPITKKVTITPTVSFMRLRWEKDQDDMFYGGRGGLSLSVEPKRDFVISLFAEMGANYQIGSPVIGKAGVRIGHTFSNVW